MAFCPMNEKVDNREETGGTMLRTIIAAILVALLAAPALAGENTGEEIEWIPSFDKAVELAKKTDRHLVANVFSPT